MILLPKDAALEVPAGTGGDRQDVRRLMVQRHVEKLVVFS